MKRTISLVVLLAASLVVGCSASASVGSKTPADWRMAYVCGGPEVAVCYCDKNKAGEERVYLACLEELQRQKIASGGTSAPPAPPPATATASAPPPPVAPPPNATAPVQPPSPPPGVQPTPVPGVNYTWVPGGNGLQCKAQTELTLIVENTSDYLVEVRGGEALKPLPCDAVNKLVGVAVIRRNGQHDVVWAIPPHITVKYVFDPYVGGLGQPPVYYTAFSNMGCGPDPAAPGRTICLPNPAVKHMERQYNVPQSNGKENSQTVSDGYLQTYK